jgi:hypothetical protein
MREMPTGKDKYRGIERALKQLLKEGCPIHMEPDRNGIMWYSAGEGFGQFVARSLNIEGEKIRKESILREFHRLDEILRIEHRSEIRGLNNDCTPLDPSIIEVNHGVTFEIPLNPYKEKTPMIQSISHETTFNISLSAIPKLMPLLKRTLYLDVKLNK